VSGEVRRIELDIEGNLEIVFNNDMEYPRELRLRMMNDLFKLKNNLLDMDTSEYDHSRTSDYFKIVLRTYKG
jgi:hypothetical protein